MPNPTMAADMGFCSLNHLKFCLHVSFPQLIPIPKKKSSPKKKKKTNQPKPLPLPFCGDNIINLLLSQTPKVKKKKNEKPSGTTASYKGAFDKINVI